MKLTVLPLTPFLMTFRSKGAAMDDFFVDLESINQCMQTFSPQEMAAYWEYLNRLLSDGRLMAEDAMEAAFHRVMRGRCVHGR